jgi:hypothetical protein
MPWEKEVVDISWVIEGVDMPWVIEGDGHRWVIVGGWTCPLDQDVHAGPVIHGQDSSLRRGWECKLMIRVGGGKPDITREICLICL